MYDLETKEVFVSREVVFFEEEFPITSLKLGTNHDYAQQGLFQETCDDDFVVGEVSKGHKRDILGQHNKMRELQKKHWVVDIMKNTLLFVCLVV